MGTWSIEILQCGSGPSSNFLSKILGVNTPLFLRHTVLLQCSSSSSFSHDQACIHVIHGSSVAECLPPAAGCQVSNATVVFCFSFHSYMCFFLLQTMSVMELWRVDIMLSISVTHVYHNCLRSTSPMIYDTCSYMAH